MKRAGFIQIHWKLSKTKRPKTAGQRRRNLLLVCAACALALSLASLSSSWGQNPPRGTLTPQEQVPVAVGGGEIGDLLRKWYREGTAAGNWGDYYDNRDNGHSRLRLDPFPQLQQIEYTDEQIEARRNWGMQTTILPHVVFGNSSTSASPEQGGSNVRHYYTNPSGLEFLFAQYVRNNLYIYPEHRDHDAGHNGLGGYGDLFPTNTPYLIASQGSSGSDQPFMRAMPSVLAAFRPEVKKKLIETGLLMPTIQMILRRSNRNIENDRDYLSGKAHPTVFEGRLLDARKMVEMAHGISLERIPPIALIKVQREEEPVNGTDYFEPERNEKLGDTPAVVARVFRGRQLTRTLTISAEASGDINRRLLTYHWVVLRGDPDVVRIKPLNSSMSVAEITVPLHKRRPIEPGSPLESNRVDIGVFVHNGAYYSPPAFITFYSIDSESRTYGSDGRPVEIAHGTGTCEVSVRDWSSLFDALQAADGPAAERLLRSQFTAREIAALKKVAEKHRIARSAVLAAQERRQAADAAHTKAGEELKAIEARLAAAEASHREKPNEQTRISLEQATIALAAAREIRNQTAADARTAGAEVAAAEKSEGAVLEEKMAGMSTGAAGLVERVLDSLVENPRLCDENAPLLEALYKEADGEKKALFDEAWKSLKALGMIQDKRSFPIRIIPVRRGTAPLEERLTEFERLLLQRLNAAALSGILLPDIVKSEWRRNYVDPSIAAHKNWRDVYHYAPDGTPSGWTRYVDEKTLEFNREGLLVLENDSQGRCTKARVVRYEVEEPKQNPGGRFQRSVKFAATNEVRRYEYNGPDDWQGHGKSP